MRAKAITMNSVCILRIILLHLVALIASQGTTILLEYELPEEESPGYNVGNLAIDAKFSSKYNATVVNRLQYSFVPQAKNYDSFFSIRSDGTLAVAARVDRDALCPYLAICQIHLDVQVQPTEFFHILKITLTIKDLNDNAPRFPTSIQLNIPESAATGTLLPITPIADDPDSPAYGISRYQLSDSDGMFDLSVTSTQGVWEPHLLLKKELDREKVSEYNLQLTAIDGGSRSGTAALRVVILDVNDNPAVFKNQTYDVTVNENLSKNTVIVRVEAMDADAGDNGVVIYSFTARTAQAMAGLFRIDPSTGEIEVIGSLDYEAAKSYALTVTARDKDPASIPAQAKVNIHVNDLNDNAPEIQINTLNAQGVLPVPENSDLDTFVAHIKVTDGDEGQNGQTECSIVSDVFALTQFYAGEYKLVTKAAVDREVRSRYDIMMTCQDKGANPQSSTKVIPILIEDKNDNAPAFTRSIYATSVLEGNKPGDKVLQVNANDADIGENAELTYSIHGDGYQMFSINAQNGTIKAKVQLDREVQDQVHFTVVVRDGGKPSMSASASVVLDIMDIDDSLPTFNETGYQFSITENLSINQKVGQVAAYDLDTDPYNDFTFNLDPTFNAANTFRIDPVSGEIFSMQSLDRENIEAYNLRVTAVGFGVNALSSSVIVTVQVLDVNDWDPQFDFPRFDNSSVNITEEFPPGKAFAKVTAHDNDKGRNAELIYSIVGTNNSLPFNIDPVSGLLSFKELTQPLEELYTIKLRATDKGKNPRHTDTFLKVNCSLILHRDATLLQSNKDIVIIIGVVSGAVIVILIIGIVCLLRCKQCLAMSKTPVKYFSNSASGENKQNKENSQYENGAYLGSPVNTGDGKSLIKYNSIQAPSTDTRPRDPVFLRNNHSDYLVTNTTREVRFKDEDPGQKPLHVKTSDEKDSDQSRDSDSGRGSNEEVGSEPGSPRWDGPPPPRPPRSKPSMLTKGLLPGIHEVEPQGAAAAAPEDPSSIPGALQPRDLYNPYALPPRAPSRSSLPSSHPYKDNLPYYQNSELREPYTNGTPRLNSSFNIGMNNSSSEEFFNLDTGYLGQRSVPSSPMKKKIKHVSQV